MRFSKLLLIAIVSTRSIWAHKEPSLRLAPAHEEPLDRRLNDDDTPRRCGTRVPTEDEVLAAIQIEKEYFESINEQQQANVPVVAPSPAPDGHRSLFTNPSPGTPEQPPTEPTPMMNTPDCPPTTPVTISVPTYYHVISPTSGPSPVTDSVVQMQHTHLNNAFCGTGFGFTLTGITRTTNDVWYQDGDERAMKSTLRVGGKETLNIYFNTAGEGILGYAYFPSASDLTLDGVTVDDRTYPGGSSVDYNEGDTLVHEVGHWLGLFHTFDNGCSPIGDGIDDTPAEAVPNYGCPETLPDTCTSAGFDPINNFMDYSDDDCLFEFTPNQVSRMISQWNTYRAP